MTSYLPTRNYRCSGSSITKCSRNVRDIKIGDIVGEGGFGKVYKAEGYLNNKKIVFAIKIIKDAVMEDYMEEEIEFSYYMGEMGIGPHVYDAFFYTDDDEETYTQVIFMEYMDTDCGHVLRDEKIDDNRKRNIVGQITTLVYKQIFETGLICFDQKPNNFVYSFEDNVVKLIDFGAEFCSTKPDIKKNREIYLSVIYTILLIQLFFLTSKLGVSKYVLGVFKENKYYPDGSDTQIKNIVHILNSDQTLNLGFSGYVINKLNPTQYDFSKIKELIYEMNKKLHKKKYLGLF
jgi:serine/threonine protein kinase